MNGDGCGASWEAGRFSERGVALFTSFGYNIWCGSIQGAGETEADEPALHREPFAPPCSGTGMRYDG